MNKVYKYVIGLKKQFIKYALVGVLNFVVSLLFFLLLLKVFGVPYLVAFTITWLFGILLTYIINFVWVFKPEDKFEFRKRLPKYFLVYLASYIVNLFILRLIVENYSYDPFWVQFFILPLVVLINFFGFKYWALNPVPKK